MLQAAAVGAVGAAAVGAKQTHLFQIPSSRAVQATDAWELLNSMLSAARDALRADDSLGRDEQEAAAEGLSAVRGHVTAARLLTKHGLTTSPRRAPAIPVVVTSQLRL